MTNDIEQQISTVIDNQIRPLLQSDGGDISVVCFKDNILTVKLTGACSCCPHAQATLKNVVENAIHQAVSSDIIIETI